MDFSTSEEQNLIKESFRTSFSGLVSLNSIRKTTESKAPFDPILWSDMSAMGLHGLLISERYGGSGLSLFEAAIVAEELGRSMAPIPFVATSIMAPLLLMSCGSESQKKKWLPQIASGNARIGVAVSEIAGGTRGDEELLYKDEKLSGKASFTLDCGGAVAFIIADKEGHLYIVEAGDAGLKREAFPAVDGTRAVEHLVLQSVNAEPLESATRELIDQVISAGRIILAAESLGASEAMLEQAVNYAGERKQFDRVIGSFQAVKHMCAEMAAEIQPCRALVWYAAYAFDHLKEEVALSACLAKSHMDEVSRFVAKTSTQVHGGMGYTDLQGLHF